MSEIRFYNRYTDSVDTEVIYGEGFLRWTYETAFGRAGLWLLARRIFFSRWYGWRMSRPASAAKIRPFIAAYGLDENAFLEPVSSYRTFNDFFYRKLRPDARPLAAGEEVVALPADGRHLGLQNVDTVAGIYAKGQRFDVASLLGDAELGRRFAGATAVISRLCPVDYHRYHSPVSGRVVDQRILNGWLYSVSPIALRRAANYLWENKRVLTLIDTERFGQVAYIAIGATCVGSIIMTKGTGDTVAKGDELGYFAFGGSCVITLFQKGRVELADDLAERGVQGLEVYAQVGDVLGRATGSEA